jgi:predicted nucleic-acid-binding Zn-ribbon protein
MSVSSTRQAGSPTMPPISDCQLGEWYLVVACKKCGERDVLFRDPSKGKGKIRQTYRHRCAKCQHTAYYEEDDIERFHCIERRKKPS